jgi:hypothetical protein
VSTVRPNVDVEKVTLERNANAPFVDQVNDDCHELSVRFLSTKGQFHQCSMRSFYVCKFCMQLFCAYILGLHFSGARLLAQKLRVEH